MKTVGRRIGKGSAWMVVTALFLATGLAVATSVTAAEENSIEEMIASAGSAADHEAIAEHYDRQKEDALTRAESHRNMSKAYEKRGGSLTKKRHLDRHCADLAKRYEADAEAYGKMAEAHREATQEAK